MLSGAALLLAVFPSLGQAPPAITGDYIEARSNHVYGCYCEWSGESVTGGKEAVLAWRITAGRFDSADLAGLAMAAVVVGETTLSAGSGKRRSTLFIDSRAAAPARVAAERWLRATFGQLIGEVIAVHSQPISLERSAASASLRVGTLLNLTLRKAVLPDDALQGAILWFDPFIPLEESTLGTTLRNRYWGDDFGSRWDRGEPSITGYFGRFSTGGDPAARQITSRQPL